MNSEVKDIFNELETDLESCFYRYKRSFSYKRGPYSLDWLEFKRRDAESEAIGRIMSLPGCENRAKMVRKVREKTDEIEYEHFGALNKPWESVKRK